MSFFVICPCRLPSVNYLKQKKLIWFLSGTYNFKNYLTADAAWTLVSTLRLTANLSNPPSHQFSSDKNPSIINITLVLNYLWSDPGIFGYISNQKCSTFLASSFIIQKQANTSFLFTIYFLRTLYSMVNVFIFCRQGNAEKKCDRNVLNDIGSMLEDLTSELDALLDVDSA